MHRNLNYGLKVEQSKTGQGVFAMRPFREGEFIGEIQGRVIDDPDYSSDYCIDLGGNLSLEPDPPFCYLNHSCDPNCGFWSYEVPQAGEEKEPSSMIVEASRPIPPGEELTIDYSWPAQHAIPCRCGSPKCRGWIVAKNQLPLLRIWSLVTQA